jgi:hypothetical protein
MMPVYFAFIEGCDSRSRRFVFYTVMAMSHSHFQRKNNRKRNDWHNTISDIHASYQSARIRLM